jgi:RNA polymerase sigma-70 factor (ECF subfamily)
VPGPSGNHDGAPPRTAAEPTSTSLVERVRLRDAAAWQRLVDLYGPTVYGWCRAGGLLAHDAADVVQDVFAAVAGGIVGFRGEGPCGSFRAWLRTITHNKLADFYRRQGEIRARGGSTAYGNLMQLAEPWEASQSGSLVADADDGFWRRALNLVRTEFEERTWQAFWRVTVDGQTTAEVAAALGISTDSVYQAKSRVLRRLRQELAGLEPPP